MRLAGKGTVREVVQKGLDGTTRVEELLQLACLALGVEPGPEVALWSQTRLLRATETLAEAGVSAWGVVDLVVGVDGGMQGGDVMLAALFGEVSHDACGVEAALDFLSAVQAENRPGMGDEARCPHVEEQQPQSEVKSTTGRLPLLASIAGVEATGEASIAGKPAMSLDGKGLDTKELQRQLEESKEQTRQLEAELRGAGISSTLQVTSPRS